MLSPTVTELLTEPSAELGLIVVFQLGDRPFQDAPVASPDKER